MIQESYYWKASLLRAANWLERLRIEESTAEHSLVRAVRDLIVGFYAIRKLWRRLSSPPAQKSMKFSLTSSSCIKMVDYMNAHRVEKLFDLAVTHVEEHNLEFLCNQFIHSYVFVTAQQEDGSLAGAYVSSDRARKDKVFFVEIA